MKNEGSFQDIFSVVKGVLVSLGCALLLTFLFANVLRFGKLSNGVIYPVNQAIKVISVAVGALLFVRGEKGWLKGGGLGLAFTMLSYLAFSAIGNDFSLSWLIITELLTGIISGALCGIIAVNVRG